LNLTPKKLAIASAVIGLTPIVLTLAYALINKNAAISSMAYYAVLLLPIAILGGIISFVWHTLVS